MKRRFNAVCPLDPAKLPGHVIQDLANPPSCVSFVWPEECEFPFHELPLYSPDLNNLQSLREPRTMPKLVRWLIRFLSTRHRYETGDKSADHVTTTSHT